MSGEPWSMELRDPNRERRHGGNIPIRQGRSSGRIGLRKLMSLEKERRGTLETDAYHESAWLCTRYFHALVFHGKLDVPSQVPGLRRLVGRYLLLSTFYMKSNCRGLDENTKSATLLGQVSSTSHSAPHRMGISESTERIFLFAVLGILNYWLTFCVL